MRFWRSVTSKQTLEGSQSRLPGGDADAVSFRLGLFVFDAATRELRREGTLVHLQAQPAQVLGALLEHAGQVVSREELRKGLWGSETFVDFDRGLNFCISQIRSALKDESSQPTYIRTVPKQGYQFIAPVERVSKRLPNDATASARTARFLRPSVLAGVAGALVVMVLAAHFAHGRGYLVRRKTSLAEAPIIAVLRFDNETGNPAMTRFSDALTDEVVEEMTTHADGQYRVVGNASILRGPRSSRDLNTVASTLHASFVVLGQVQSEGAQLRILAHLIRLPDQTHIWVVRSDSTLTDPLRLEKDLAATIALEFSSRLPKHR